MVKLILTFILLSFLPAGISKNIFHDIHISKCEIQFNEETSAFEVATQIYLDDLQKSLTNSGVPDLHLFTDKESKDADNQIYSYLSKKLLLEVNDKAISGTFIGREQSEDLLAIWCYIEFKSIREFNRIKIKYDVLMDIYDDQKNIVNIKAKGKKGYVLLHTKHMEETINY
ncbi:MAG: hypothetical protein KA143_10030 [Saprospiraceae bacterium]|nr:hypothetical protein [Saprospiraceae bacterium]